MIVTMTAYAPAKHGKDLGYAYNESMERLRDSDWACFIDHDALWTTPKWYRQLETIVAGLTQPALLTAVTNRVGCKWQRAGVEIHNHDYNYHRKIGADRYARFGTQLRDVTDESLLSGVVMLFPKSLWRAWGGCPSGFLGVDNELHKRTRKAGHRVYLMEGVYVYHWYRDGATSKLRPSGGLA